MMYLLLQFDPTHGERRSEIMAGAHMLLLALLTAATLQNFSMDTYRLEDVRNYDEFFTLIDSCSDGEIYLGMLANSYLLRDVKQEPDYIWYDDGHIQYFNKDTSGGNAL